MTTETASGERAINYAFLLGGLTALVFGIILLVRREEAVALLMVVLGLWWLIQGAFMLFAVFIDREDVGWKLAIGALGLIAGILVLSNPGDAADLFAGAIGVILGIIGILIGISALVGAFRGAGFGAAMFGLVSFAIGLLVLLNGQFTTELLVTLFALLLILDGVTGIYLAFKYK